MTGCSWPQAQSLPVDGRLLTRGTFDESSLTGESDPVEREVGEDVRSGVLNSGAAAEMVATTTSADSTYSQIVRLVEESQASSAPFVRTADRFAHRLRALDHCSRAGVLVGER